MPRSLLYRGAGAGCCRGLRRLPRAWGVDAGRGGAGQSKIDDARSHQEEHALELACERALREMAEAEAAAGTMEKERNDMLLWDKKVVAPVGRPRRRGGVSD